MGGQNTMNDIMGPLQMGAGAGLTAAGAPQAGLPFMAQGASQMDKPPAPPPQPPQPPQMHPPAAPPPAPQLAQPSVGQVPGGDPQQAQMQKLLAMMGGNMGM